MLRFVLVATIAAALAGTVAAQDWRRDPAYGSVNLSTGFQPDPHTIDIRAGGSNNAQNLGGGCTGFVADAPDYRVHYQGGSSLPLILFVEAQADTTLVINGPGGQWHCDDDSAGGLNPMVRFDAPRTGQYDIWVGTFQSGGLQSSRLFITELESNAPSQQQTGQGPDWRLDPAYGSVGLNTGFQPDPHTIDIRAGGPVNAGQVGGECTGFVARAPDYRVQYQGGSSLPLIFFVRSQYDTTLVVNAPDGRWYCNDDAHGSLDPSVSFGSPQSGQYDIWIGTFTQGQLRPATLFITEIAGRDRQ